MYLIVKAVRLERREYKFAWWGLVGFGGEMVELDGSSFWMTFLSWLFCVADCSFMSSCIGYL